MRKIIFIILFFVMTDCLHGGGYISKSDTVELMAETMYLDGKMGVTDSIEVKVLHGGSVVYDSIFTSADGWCYSISTPNGNALVFSAPFDSIDGGNDDGYYKIVTWAIYGSSELRTPGESGCYRVGSPNVNIEKIQDDTTPVGNMKYYWTEGFGLAGYDTNYVSITIYDEDQDTVIVTNKAHDDTLGYFIFYHIGGSPGQEPDSTILFRK